MSEPCRRCQRVPAPADRFCDRCESAVAVADIVYEMKQTPPWRAIVWSVERLDSLLDRLDAPTSGAGETERSKGETMKRLLIMMLACVATLSAQDWLERLRPLSKDQPAETLQDFTGYCTGPVDSNNESADAAWWAGFCRFSGSERGFRIEAEIAGPIREHFRDRTVTTLTFRDDAHVAPVAYVTFSGWLGVMVWPSSSTVREEIIRHVARVNGGREPVIVKRSALVRGQPGERDRPDTHSIVIDVVGIEWPLE